MRGLLEHSVKVDHIFIPGNSLESYLGKFVTNLGVWYNDDVFKLGLVGSATPVLYKDRYFLLCSKHQLKGVNTEDVCLLYPDGSNVVTSSGVRHFNTSEETMTSDAYDLAAFEFTAPVLEHPILKHLFFRFNSLPPDTMTDEIIAFVTAGFPCDDQRYELEERNHIGLVKRILTALPDHQPHDESLLQLKYVRPLDFNPDGLSGGPAFVVQKVDNDFQAFLAGMMVRSGKSHCHILKVGFLKSFLDSFLATHD